MEEEKDRLKEIFEAIFAGAEMGIALLDLRGRVLKLNPALRRLAPSLKPGEPLWKSLAIYRRSEGDGWLDEGLRRLASGSTGSVEGEVFVKPRGDRPRRARVKLLRAGEAIALLLHEDISNALEEMAAGIAHELNSPLDAAIRYVGFLLEDMLEDDPRRRYVLRIRDALERMEGIVKGMLRLVRGGPEPFAPVDINQAVRRAVELFEDRMAESGIEVELDLDERIPKLLMGDIEQV
ncbi:hypothetical protein DRP77_03830, partial [Candidatus Poribacteria bacterium]